LRSTSALQLPQLLSDAPAELPALGLSRPDQADLIERGLERSGWLKDAKRKLRGITSAEHAVDSVFELARSSAQALEVAHFGLKVDHLHDNEVRNLLVSAYANDSAQDYYDHPQFSVWKASEDPSSNLEFKELMNVFSDVLGLRNIDDVEFDASKTDLKSIDDFQDFISFSFWSSINALHRAQRPWSPSNRFNELISNSEADAQKQLVVLRDSFGHQIHTLRAKDTTKRWAKYFVHVDPDRDEAFTSAIGGSGDTNLEDWGVVVASEYEHVFRERQTRRLRGQFNGLIDSFERVAVRARAYSFASPVEPIPYGSKSFKQRRLAKALSDTGSREALVKELVAQADAIGGSVERFELPSVPRLLFERRLNHAASIVYTRILKERRLPPAAMAPLALTVLSPASATTEAMLKSLRALSRYVGLGPADFLRFYVLVAQNRSLNHSHLLSAALCLAARKESMRRLIPSISAAVVGLMALGPAGALAGASAVRIAQHALRAERALPASSWEDTSLHLAMFDLLTHLGGDTASGLVDLIQEYCLSNEADAARRAALVASIHDSIQAISEVVSEAKPQFEGLTAIENAGIRIEMNIVKRIARASINKSNDQLDKRIWSILLRDQYTILLRLISVVGDFIESKSYIEKRYTISGIVEDGLNAAFVEAGYPEDRRSSFVERLVDALLSHDRPMEGSWAEKVAGESRALPLKVASDTPGVAPAIWRADKLSDDTPPDFIKRYYGPWLRADATGLTRPDIRRLDISLYTALANWLKKNDLPADCPVPSKSEAVTAELSKAIDDPALVNAKLWVRKQSHDRYHRNRNQKPSGV
jgi:hypothetical protein